MSLQLRGINYDTGTEFISNEITRVEWNLKDIQSDFSIIKNDLHCNAINLYGTNKTRLLESIQIALENDLLVFAQLRTIDKTQKEMHLTVLDFAEELSRLYNNGNIVLNIGCEASLFAKGFIPGKTFLNRMFNMIWIWPFLSIINRKLSHFLNGMANDIRKRFKGQIIYGSGSWENINWDGFDYIGVNLYRDKENLHMYKSLVRELGSNRKPAIVTEFGCCTFNGASLVGGGGWTIIDYKSKPPKLKRNIERNEAEQAKLLVDSIRLFNESNIYGCFVFDFIETQQLFSENPLYDLDKASYGIVKAIEKNGSIIWEKKEAFSKVSEEYNSLTTTI